MNRFIASFTRAERMVISFTLALLVAGLGVQELSSSKDTTIQFSAVAPPIADPVNESVSVTLPGLAGDGRININAADEKLLDTLPGIGPAMASAITRYRMAHGPFRSMIELDKVPGIGPAMISKLGPLVSFGEGAGDEQSEFAVAAAPVPSLAASNAPSVTTGDSNMININRASAGELDQLTGVGPAIAGRIVEDRQVNGEFPTVESLTRVKGIGPSILAKNRNRICVR